MTAAAAAADELEEEAIGGIIGVEDVVDFEGGGEPKEAR